MLACTSVHMPFDDPTNLFQGLRKYIGLLVSLLLAQSLKKNNNKKKNTAKFMRYQLTLNSTVIILAP